MKTKVIIENGVTTIELTPENDFERNMIENVSNDREVFNIDTKFHTEHNKHKITLKINEIVRLKKT
jgi:hypothetical protein